MIQRTTSPNEVQDKRHTNKKDQLDKSPNMYNVKDKKQKKIISLALNYHSSNLFKL